MSRTDELLETIDYAKLTADVLWKDIDIKKHRKLLDELASIVKREAECVKCGECKHSQRGTIYDKEARE